MKDCGAKSLTVPLSSKCTYFSILDLSYNLKFFFFIFRLANNDFWNLEQFEFKLLVYIWYIFIYLTL